MSMHFMLQHIAVHQAIKCGQLPFNSGIIKLSPELNCGIPEKAYLHLCMRNGRFRVAYLRRTHADQYSTPRLHVDVDMTSERQRTVVMPTRDVIGRPRGVVTFNRCAATAASGKTTRYDRARRIHAAECAGSRRGRVNRGQAATSGRRQRSIDRARRRGC